MTRTSRKISILAGLLLTVIALSVFAAPTAASEHTADFAVDADEIADDGISQTETATLTVEHDSVIESGSQIEIQLNDETIQTFDEGDFEIDSVSVDDGGTNLPEDVTAEAATEKSNVYLGKTDTITVTLESEDNSQLSMGGEDLALDIQLDIGSGVNNSAADYNGENDILAVHPDGTDFGTAPTGGVGTISIDPGTAQTLALDGPDNMVYSDSETVSTTAQDAHGNDVDEYDTGDAEFSLVGADTENGVNRNVNADIATGIADITLGSNGELTPAVGELELQVEHSEDSLAGSAQGLNITADTVDVELAENFDADEGQTELTINLTNGTDKIPAKDLDASVPATFELTETAVADTDADIVQIGDFNEDGQVATTLTQPSHTKDFNTTYAATHGVKVTALPDTNAVSGSDTVEVSPGTATQLDLQIDDDEIEYKNDTAGDETTARAYVLDQYGNELSDADIKGETPRLTFSLVGKNGEVASTKKTVTSSETTVTITDAGELDSQIGDFEVHIEDDIDGLHDDDSENLRVVPTDIQIEAGEEFTAEEHTADGAGSDVIVTIVDSSGASLDDADIDSIDVFVGPTEEGTTLQPNDASVDIQVSGVDENYEATFEDAQQTFDFTSTTAGVYQIISSVLAGDRENPADNIVATDTVEVHPTAIAQIDIDAEHDFVGTVTDDNTAVELNVKLLDEFGNYADYDGNNADSVTVNLTRADESEEHPITINTGDYTGTVTKTTGYHVVDFDPETNVNDDFTGELEMNADTGQVAMMDAESVEVVHEAQNLEQGWQRISVPQPGVIETEYVNDMVFYNNTEEAEMANYDTSSEENLGLTEFLHYGHFISGVNESARVGFNFDEPSEATSHVGSVELQDGWNYLGTNVDITPETNPLDKDLSDDLANIEEIEPNMSANEFVLDGDFTGPLDAQSTGTTIGDLIDGVYGTYWIHIDETDDLRRDSRAVNGPAYEPSPAA